VVAPQALETRLALWTGLTIGASIGLLALIAVLFRKNQHATRSTPTLGCVPLIPTIQIFHNMVPVAHPLAAQTAAPLTDLPITHPLALAPGQDPHFDASTVMRTSLLFSDGPQALYTAPPGMRARVVARTIGPPGGFTVLSTNSGALRATGVPIGSDVIVIPTGGWNEIVLQPMQTLYGKGSVAETIVSIVANKEPVVVDAPLVAPILIGTRRPAN
jgi:hypothetical protein